MRSTERVRPHPLGHDAVTDVLDALRYLRRPASVATSPRLPTPMDLRWVAHVGAAPCPGEPRP